MPRLTDVLIWNHGVALKFSDVLTLDGSINRRVRENDEDDLKVKIAYVKYRLINQYGYNKGMDRLLNLKFVISLNFTLLLNINKIVDNKKGLMSQYIHYLKMRRIKI